MHSADRRVSYRVTNQLPLGQYPVFTEKHNTVSSLTLKSNLPSRTFAFRRMLLKARRICWRELTDLCSHDTLQTLGTSLLSTAYVIMQSVNKNCRRITVYALGRGGGVVVPESRHSRDTCLEGMTNWRETSARTEGMLGWIQAWVGAAGYEALTCSHNVRSTE